MADLTHAGFRDLVARWGGCGLFYTEMLNARIVASSDPAKDPYCAAGVHDTPRACQLVGDNPETLAEAFRRLQKLGRFQVYDVNLGCSRGMPARHGWGAALLQRPAQVRKMLTEIRNVVHGPLWVKMRIPDGDEAALEQWAEMLQDCGVDAVVLHARYAQDLFKRPARWQVLARFKALCRQPVIGNGDIFSPQDAVRMMAVTGCDAVMIGRAALMRPWIFSDLAHYVQTGALPRPPGVGEVVCEYAGILAERYEEPEAARRLRLFAFWICQNFPYGAYYFQSACRQQTFWAMVEALRTFLNREPLPAYPVRPYLM